MSVLFKALSRAAKTRESATGSAAPIGQPAIFSRGGNRGGNKRVLMLAGALCVGLAGGTYLFFIAGDDSPPVRPSAPAKPRPRPVIPGAAQQQAAVAPAVSPTPSPESAPAPAPAAPVVAAAPAAEQPEVKLAPMQAAAPPPAATASTLPPPPAGVAPAAQLLPVKPKAAAPVMPIEEDLPTLLARLRRQKMEPAVSQPVTVARTGGGQRDLLDDEGRTAIKVGVAPQTSQDAGHDAYDDLLQGRYEEALGNYDKALAAEPRSAPLLLGKATALQKLGRLADAKKAYNMVLAVDPNNREALTNQTTLLAAQAPERALTDLRALHQANPGFSPIDAEIGTQEAAAGNMPAALEAMSHAVSLSPGNGLYRLNLAILQDRAGMGADAAASYRAALDLLSAGAAGLPLPIEQIRRRVTYLEGR